MKNMDFMAWTALFASRGTPPAIVAKLNAALNTAVRADRLKSVMNAAGFQPRGGTPQALANAVKREIDMFTGVIEKAGIPTRLVAPHKAFNRKIGTLAGVKVSPDGRVVSEGEWAQQASQWLPSAEDRAFVSSLMGRVVEPGKYANWIAPPPIGINKQAPDFEYIRFS